MYRYAKLESRTVHVPYLYIKRSLDDRIYSAGHRIQVHVEIEFPLLGGLSMTDHLLISLEFSFFIYSLFIYFYFFRTLFLCIRLLEIDLVNFLQISVSH